MREPVSTLVALQTKFPNFMPQDYCFAAAVAVGPSHPLLTRPKHVIKTAAVVADKNCGLSRRLGPWGLPGRIHGL